MVDLTEYQYEDCLIRIICVDNQVIEGHVISVDDEEESGLGEIGITIITDYGRYIGIGESEIRYIERIFADKEYDSDPGGILTMPFDPSLPTYNLKKLTEYCRKVEKKPIELTDEERNMFRTN